MLFGFLDFVSDPFTNRPEYDELPAGHLSQAGILCTIITFRIIKELSKKKGRVCFSHLNELAFKPLKIHLKVPDIFYHEDEGLFLSHYRLHYMISITILIRTGQFGLMKL